MRNEFYLNVNFVYYFDVNCGYLIINIREDHCKTKGFKNCKRTFIFLKMSLTVLKFSHLFFKFFLNVFFEFLNSVKNLNF